MVHATSHTPWAYHMIKYQIICAHFLKLMCRHLHLPNDISGCAGIRSGIHADKIDLLKEKNIHGDKLVGR